MIHSIIPYQTIFEKKEKDTATQKQYINFEQGMLEVMPQAENSYIVNRIITTSLKPYLDNDFQPGSIIK